MPGPRGYLAPGEVPGPGGCLVLGGCLVPGGGAWSQWGAWSRGVPGPGGCLVPGESCTVRPKLNKLACPEEGPSMMRSNTSWVIALWYLLRTE